jgi:hypothetical protein
MDMPVLRPPGAAPPPAPAAASGAPAAFAFSTTGEDSLLDALDVPEDDLEDDLDALRASVGDGSDLGKVDLSGLEEQDDLDESLDEAGGSLSDAVASAGIEVEEFNLDDDDDDDAPKRRRSSSRSATISARSKAKTGRGSARNTKPADSKWLLNLLMAFALLGALAGGVALVQRAGSSGEEGAGDGLDEDDAYADEDGVDQD